MTSGKYVLFHVSSPLTVDEAVDGGAKVAPVVCFFTPTHHLLCPTLPLQFFFLFDV